MYKIAILYQANLPPIKGGVQKPKKPGGYSDSGADIAVELRKNNLEVVTPNANPNVKKDLDWVFPDTKKGINNAIKSGANIFWLNTVLYKNHPIENVFKENKYFVGQTPESVDVYDDKLYTNLILKSNNLPIPKAQLIKKENFKNITLEINFPLVVKPIRGRGSQGVFFVKDENKLEVILNKLFSTQKYGNALYLEEYLSGEEITITVMPKGVYRINKQNKYFKTPWCLPAVKRINHINGIAPYNGLVAVMENSAVLDEKALGSKEIKKVNAYCIKAAEIIQIKAPIRIDCRMKEKEKYYLFDINMKPNMTGPSRYYRKNQDSLTLIVARNIGWNYFDLLENILNQKWSV